MWVTLNYISGKQKSFFGRSITKMAALTPSILVCTLLYDVLPFSYPGEQSTFLCPESGLGCDLLWPTECSRRNTCDFQASILNDLDLLLSCPWNTSAIEEPSLIGHEIPQWDEHRGTQLTACSNWQAHVWNHLKQSSLNRAAKLYSYRSVSSRNQQHDCPTDPNPNCWLTVSK